MPGIFFLLIAVVVVLAIFGGMQAAKRRDALAKWAASQGLSFSAERDHSFKERYPDFAPLRSGQQNRYAHNIMQGVRNNRRIVCFDYHYETTSRDSKGKTSTHHHHFSAIIIHPGHALHPIHIRPEGLFDRVTEFLGFDDIDFESAAFSRKFFVKSENRRWAFDIIHPETMEYMLARPRYTMQMDRSAILIINNKRWGPAEFEQALRYLEGFLDLIPRGVIEEVIHG